MTDDFLKDIPTLERLEARFSFIRHETLRENATIYFRYIILLLAISEEDNLDTLKYSVYKDIIIYTASIVESVLEYAVKEFVINGKATDQVFGYSYYFTEVSPINHVCDDFKDARFIVAKKEKKYKWKPRELDFTDINKAAKTAGILDKNLFNMADSLREKRNLIHLGSLDKSSNDYIQKDDVQKALQSAHDIIIKVEQELISL